MNSLPSNKIYINSYLYDSYRSTDFIARTFHAFVYNSISLILEESLILVIESTYISMHIHSISYFPLSSIFQACHQVYNQFVSLHFFKQKKYFLDISKFRLINRSSFSFFFFSKTFTFHLVKTYERIDGSFNVSFVIYFFDHRLLLLSRLFIYLSIYLFFLSVLLFFEIHLDARFKKKKAHFLDHFDSRSIRHAVPRIISKLAPGIFPFRYGRRERGGEAESFWQFI